MVIVATAGFNEGGYTGLVGGQMVDGGQMDNWSHILQQHVSTQRCASRW